MSSANDPIPEDRVGNDGKIFSQLTLALHNRMMIPQPVMHIDPVTLITDTLYRTIGQWEANAILLRC